MSAEINIIDYIPHGKQNAVSRAKLVSLTGVSDRKVRGLISSARKEYVILSSDNGNGYYQPTPDDYPELRKILKREESRAKSVFGSIKKLRALCEDYEHGRLNKT